MLQISSTVIVGTLKRKRQMHRNIVLFQDLQILQCNECQTEVVSSVYSIYYYSGIQSIEHASGIHMIDRRQIIGTLHSFSGGLAKVRKTKRG